jgi:hypothetical protein
MDIEIAETDLGNFDWYYAIEYCNKNPQWRLPNRLELNWMYKNYFKKDIGDFENTYYWSMDELSTQYAWSINFDTGVQHYYTKLHKNNIRLIKNSGIQ